MTLENLATYTEQKTLHLDTPYGTLVVNDPLAIDLIQSHSFQRLKEINQYGVVNFIVPTENYTRFDHSIGVYHLLIAHECSREEQIAGLLHDVSHTVFSHVGDYVFEEKSPGSSYQDDIHLWYLETCGLSKILEKHSYTKEKIDHKNPVFSALDRPLPELCADRIEYNLQGGLLRNLLTPSEFQEINQSLSYKSGRWTLDSLECAKKIGSCSLIMTETLWSSAWEALSYRLTAEALRHSFTIALVTFDEFHFSTDISVWRKLKNSNDPYIKERMDKIENIHSAFALTDHGKEDILLKLKFRGVDPLVATDKGTFPLTTLDSAYHHEYHRVKEKIEQGWAIKFS